MLKAWTLQYLSSSIIINNCSLLIYELLEMFKLVTVDFLAGELSKIKPDC
jgi:hypothetical protein